MKLFRVILLSLAMLPFGAFVAHAQSSTEGQPIACTCFCGDTSSGAVKVDGATTPDSCSAACVQQKKTYVTCAPSPAEFPDNNLVCYTQSECESQLDKHSPPRPIGKWDTAQAFDCPSGKRYCYPQSYPDINLSFALGGVSQVSDLAQYIGLAYNVLLGISVTIAIVMLMIGGFQYVIGAGSPEQLTKGKTRMKNAAIGLVLLMSAYVILFTVNPQLIRLQLPTLRMTKGVQFISENTSCETLKQYTFGKITPNKNGDTNQCGAIVEVLKDDRGTAVTGGTTCMRTFCPDKKTCNGQGKDAVCVSCTDVFLGSPVLSKSDAAICASLTPAQAPAQNSECFFSGAVAGSVGGCALAQFDCTNVKTCDDYKNTNIKAADVSKTVSSQTINGTFRDEFNHLCTSNPCIGNGAPGLQKGCAFTPSITGSGPCVSK